MRGQRSRFALCRGVCGACLKSFHGLRVERDDGVVIVARLVHQQAVRVLLLDRRLHIGSRGVGHGGLENSPPFI